MNHKHKESLDEWMHHHPHKSGPLTGPASEGR